MTGGPEYPTYDRGDDDQRPRGESDDIADVFNRFTFDSGRSRRRRRRQSETPREPEPVERERSREEPRPRPPVSSTPPQETPRPPAPQWDAPMLSQPRRVSRPEPEPVRPTEPEERAVVQDPVAAETGETTAASSVRSYAWTGGRTKSNFNLELETLVSTSEAYRPGPMVRHEHQSIAELCQHPRSVAEVGALLGVPVGVARVLLADMAELGWITVHHTVTDGGSAPHLMLMERVLSGLRRL